MGIISIIANIVAWVVGIIVLIKLFQKEGVLKGILGIICMLYTFIWGWIHRKEQSIENIMYIWTGVVVLSVIINVISNVMASSGN
jgi:hypothetical protein